MSDTTSRGETPPRRSSGASKAYAVLTIVLIPALVAWRVSSDPRHGTSHIGAAIVLGILSLLLLHSTAWQVLRNRKPIDPNSTIYAILCFIVALLISH